MFPGKLDMIEVEKKCIPTQFVLEYLNTSAEIKNAIVLKDICMDFEDFRLIKNDFWLRYRNGSYGLKKPIVSEKWADVYEEIEDESKILEEIKLTNFHDDNLKRISHLITNRKEFKLEQFNIVIDEVTSPGTDFFYKLMEIEILINKEDAYDSAQRKIFEFMKKHSIIDQQVNSKFIEYVKNFNPVIYEVLKAVRKNFG